MNDTDFSVSGTITKYGDAAFLIRGPLDLRNLGAVGEMLAVSGKAVSVRGHHRGIGNDHLDTVFGLTDGDILPVFVSAEIRKREPVRDLQGVLVLCREGDAGQDGEQHHDDYDWRGWISCHGSLLRFCKSKSVASVQAVLRSAREVQFPCQSSRSFGRRPPVAPPER